MKKISDNSGLSLLEVLVAMAIFIAATVSVLTFINQGFFIQNFSLEQTIAIQEAKRGVDVMVREIREAQPADTGAYPIVEADDQQLIFYGDFDKDSAVERVRYFLDGSEFKKGVIEPRTSPIEYVEADEQVTILSRYVRNETDPVFVYYNGDWPGDTISNPLTTPAGISDVRYINVRLNINVRPTVAPSDFLLLTDIQLRNLKDNL